MKTDRVRELVDALGIDEMTTEKWLSAMQILEWRFMFELRIPPHKIEEAIRDHLPCAHKLVEDYVDLMAMKPYFNREKA